MAPANFMYLVLLLAVFLSVPTTGEVDLNFPAIFNFGDSNSDTGNLVAAMGERLDPPNGETFFNSPAGRFCDGRLIVDFLSDAFNLPLLDPYLDSLDNPDFRKGCNFAAAGSTILPATASAVSPFSFRIQVYQFLSFKAKVLQLRDKGDGSQRLLPKEEIFNQSLYMFDIGQNDLAGAFYSKTEDQVIASIPTILSEFEDGVEDLYEEGARRFWIHNTGPLGCLAQNVARFGQDQQKLDELGCVASHNRAAKLFNLQLHALISKWRGQFSDASFTYVDIFTIKVNLIANFSKYGFEQPIMACCGYGGPPLNYDSRVSCGRTKIINGTSVTAGGCSDVTDYVNWDGIHYTEAANFHVASRILTGKFSDPPFVDKVPFSLKLRFQA
ncbi:unnamed protein product [Victoria cruziana]